MLTGGWRSLNCAWMLLSLGCSRKHTHGGASCASLLNAADSAILSNPVVKAATDSVPRLADARVHRLALGDSAKGVLAISWEAPPGGLLLLTDCRRSAYSATPMARVDSMQRLSADDG